MTAALRPCPGLQFQLNKRRAIRIAKLNVKACGIRIRIGSNIFNPESAGVCTSPPMLALYHIRAPRPGNIKHIRPAWAKRLAQLPFRRKGSRSCTTLHSTAHFEYPPRHKVAS